MEMTISEKIQSFIENLEVAPAKFQQEAFERLAAQDFPTTRDEYWKYTRLGKLSKNTLRN